MLRHSKRLSREAVPGGVQDRAEWGSELPGLMKGSLSMAGVLELDNLEVSSNPKHFMIL